MADIFFLLPVVGLMASFFVTGLFMCENQKAFAIGVCAR